MVKHHSISQWCSRLFSRFCQNVWGIVQISRKTSVNIQRSKQLMTCFVISSFNKRLYMCHHDAKLPISVLSTEINNTTRQNRQARRRERPRKVKVHEHVIISKVLYRKCRIFDTFVFLMAKLITLISIVALFWKPLSKTASKRLKTFAKKSVLTYAMLKTPSQIGQLTTARFIIMTAEHILICAGWVEGISEQLINQLLKRIKPKQVSVFSTSNLPSRNYLQAGSVF